jgi:uncharacterized caspase-like protein
MWPWQVDKCFWRGAVLRLLFCALMLAFPDAARSADTLKGVALVVGNGDYAALPDLPNPVNDADDLEKLFDGFGFRTEATSDRDLKRLKRDLDDFVEDADGADVAVLSYSGHGIEAGGENWLVPVDADLSSLDDASDRLVALSSVVERLQAKVPLVIVLIDACRNNPFPPGAMLRPGTADSPVPISASGLGAARGAAPIENGSGDGRDDIGIVIGLAAAPGKVALDGAPGTNSPYAAAVLKHLDAMAGTEFGVVMRMITEEVYLRTGGKQRPWVNESLRRLLYFGETPASPTGEDGQILEERRELLLTIAALPDGERRQVELAAAERGVPMDGLYGMLGALGQDTPSDPAELDKLLREQAERLKGIMARHAATTGEDPEVERLSKLADRAIAEGAVRTAVALRERVDGLLEASAPIVDEVEADLKDRRIARAAAFALTAATYELNSEFEKAAAKYEVAFAEVERWEEQQAWWYKRAAAESLLSHGKYRGDNAALDRAVATAGDALKFAERFDHRGNWASTQVVLGNALQAIGYRQGDAARLSQAVAAYRAALDHYTRDTAPLDWALIQNNLGASLHDLGGMEMDAVLLQQAVQAFDSALEVRTRAAMPIDWAITQVNRGNVLSELGIETSRKDLLAEGLAAFRAASEELTRDRVPLFWALTQSNIGLSLVHIGQFDTGMGYLEEAVTAFSLALEVRTRDTVPLDWAKTQVGLGLALATIGGRRHDAAMISEAIGIYRATLGELTWARAPLDWISALSNLGNALQELDRMLGAADPDRRDVALLEEAAQTYRAILDKLTRERSPIRWAATQLNLGTALDGLGERRNDMSLVEKALDAYRLALDVFRRDRLPLRWADVQFDMGKAFARLGEHRQSAGQLEAAVAAFEAALGEYTREREPLSWADAQHDLGHVLRMLGVMLLTSGQIEASQARLQAAVDAFQAALQEHTRQRDPRRWAGIQSSLGIVLALLGTNENAPARLEGAVTAFRSALEVYTRSEMPQDWAAAQSDLGIALSELGRLNSDIALLVEAVTALRSALEVSTREEAPLEWARVNLSLGRTLVDFGNLAAAFGYRDQAVSLVLEAVTAFRDSQKEYTFQKRPTEWASAQLQLARALKQAGMMMAALGSVTDGAGMLNEAAQAFRDALKVHTRQDFAREWANAQTEIGDALVALSGLTADPRPLDAALAAYHAALEVFTRQAAPMDWARTQTNMGLALVGLGSLTMSKDRILEGRAAIQSAWEVYKEAGLIEYDIYFSNILANTEAELARLN